MLLTRITDRMTIASFSNGMKLNVGLRRHSTRRQTTMKLPDKFEEEGRPTGQDTWNQTVDSIILNLRTKLTAASEIKKNIYYQKIKINFKHEKNTTKPKQLNNKKDSQEQRDSASIRRKSRVRRQYSNRKFSPKNKRNSRNMKTRSF